jgi:hypothetical protein
MSIIKPVRAPHEAAWTAAAVLSVFAIGEACACKVDLSAPTALAAMSRQQITDETRGKCTEGAFRDQIAPLLNEIPAQAAATAVKNGDLRFRYNIWPGCPQLEVIHPYNRCGASVFQSKIVLFIDGSVGASNDWCFQVRKFLANQIVDKYNDELSRIANITWCGK